jgi:hypothetical protein
MIYAASMTHGCPPLLQFCSYFQRESNKNCKEVLSTFGSKNEASAYVS